MRRIVLSLLTILLVLGGCQKGPEGATQSPPVPPAVPETPVLTAEEEEYLQTLRNNGGLTAATVPFTGAYEKTEGGGLKGFHYRMLQYLKETYEIPVRITEIEFREIFEHRGTVPAGVENDPELSYTPDIFKRADLVAFDLTPLAWRQKLMSIIPLVPTKMVLVNRRGDEIRHIGELQQKRIVVYENTSHQLYLQDLRGSLGIAFEIIPIPFNQDRFAYLIEERADYTIGDAQATFVSLPGYPNLNISLALSEAQYNGWAVSKENRVLASLLKKFFHYAEKAGYKDLAWQEGYGIPLKKYHTLIGYPPMAPLRLSRREERYLAECRSRGGLVAAIDTEKTVYEEHPDGTRDGLHYNLALTVAQILEIPIRFRPVTFYDFFRIDGVIPERIKSDADYLYTPDLLREVDLYTVPMTPLPWRRKFLAFIPIHPSRLVFISREDGPQYSESDIPGLTVALLKNTSYEKWLRSRFPAEDLQTIQADSVENSIRLVAQGRADITISDATLALPYLVKTPHLTLYPVEAPVDNLSWAVAKENDLLAGILNKSLDHIRNSGRFTAIWKEYYGSSFQDYLDFIGE